MSQDKAQPKEKMYDLVPDNFLDGMRIVPHNFDDPENPQHGDYVNAQLRYDLFYDAYNKMATIEGAQLEKDDDYVKLKQISKRKSPSWTAWIYTNFFIPKRDEQLGCEDWTLDRNGNQELSYEVKLNQFTRLFLLSYSHKVSAQYLYYYI